MDFSSIDIAALIPSLMLGIALSAASGFRVFVPLLIANLADQFNVFTLSGNMAWLGETPASIILGVAAVFELAAYYIPVVDNLLDTIAMPAAVIAGTILTASFLQIDDPVLQWGLGLIAGGGVAGTIQAGTSFLRLGSTKLTGGLGNNILTSIENGLSFFLSIVGLMLPIFIGAIVLYFVIWVWRKLWQRRKTKSI
ncbi:MAG: hypothetical protein ACI9IP_001128 [Arcticibacterium sp.]